MASEDVVDVIARSISRDYAISTFHIRELRGYFAMAHGEDINAAKRKQYNEGMAICRPHTSASCS